MSEVRTQDSQTELLSEFLDIGKQEILFVMSFTCVLKAVIGSKQLFSDEIFRIQSHCYATRRCKAIFSELVSASIFQVGDCH